MEPSAGPTIQPQATCTRRQQLPYRGYSQAGVSRDIIDKADAKVQAASGQADIRIIDA
jgi:hypothetical protein